MHEYEINSKRVLNIWGRKFDIEIIFDCFESEEISESQKNAFDDFIANFEKYTEEGKVRLEKKILAEYSSFMEEKQIKNIFKYVIPKMIYNPRSPINEKVVAVVCSFKFDEENDIAIKYIDGKVMDICEDYTIFYPSHIYEPNHK